MRKSAAFWRLSGGFPVSSRFFPAFFPVWGGKVLLICNGLTGVTGFGPVLDRFSRFVGTESGRGMEIDVDIAYEVQGERESERAGVAHLRAHLRAHRRVIWDQMFAITIARYFRFQAVFFEDSPATWPNCATGARPKRFQISDVNEQTVQNSSVLSFSAGRSIFVLQRKLVFAQFGRKITRIGIICNYVPKC
jgi:hypothetical protein